MKFSANPGQKNHCMIWNFASLDLTKRKRKKSKMRSNYMGEQLWQKLMGTLSPLSVRQVLLLFLSQIFGRKWFFCFFVLDEVAKGSENIKKAEEFDVHVVSEGFVNALKEGVNVFAITQHSIASWGSDVRRRNELGSVHSL